jgi:Na+/H+-dicarboxylate symporter
MAASSVPMEPLWSYKLPKCLGTDKALLLGFILGVTLSFLPSASSFKETLIAGSLKIREKLTWILQSLFIPFLPLYIFGFCLKLSHEKTLLFLLCHYTQVFLLSVGVVVTYLALLYTVAGRFKKEKIFALFKTMLPAGIVGFSTMSSAAALPMTLKATEKNTEDKNYTQLVVPATSNIHMLGDDLTIILTALTLLLMGGQAFPDLGTFGLFALAFCFAKLSCVGIPGASVLVILPVLEQFLGFTNSMISMLTTIYILQDPLGTFTNVMGNGAFAVLLRRGFEKCGLLKN